MSTQNRYEKKEIIYGSFLSDKDAKYWETINRRDVFREMRWIFRKLDMPMHIPLNSVEYSHLYCIAYGDKSIEMHQANPAVGSARGRYEYEAER